MNQTNALKYYEEVIRLLPDTVNDAYTNKVAARIKYLKEKEKKKLSLPENYRNDD